MIGIKEATIGDEEIVHEYIKKLAKYEDMLEEVEEDVSLITKNIFQSNVANALLMYEEDKCIGFSLYFYNFSTFLIKPGLYIEDIYIDEDYRKKGYGTQLFDYYKQLAKDKDCGRIEWICLDWNTSAIEFYENKMGAKSMNGWTIRRLISEQF